MKHITVAVMAVLTLLAFSSQADDAVPAGDKKSMFVRVDKPKYSFDEFQISPANFPNGIYVTTMKKPLFHDPIYFPKVNSIVIDRLNKLGFKIANSPDEADAVLTFNGSGELKFDEIEKGETDKISRGLSVADNVIGAVLGGKLMGSTYTMTNGVSLNLDHKNVAIEIKITGVKDKSLNKHSALTMYAEYSEDTYITSATLVSLLLDEWSKTHVVALSNLNDRVQATGTQDTSASVSATAEVKPTKDVPQGMPNTPTN